MDALDKIFGSGARVKIMRLFLFNRNIAFDIKEVVERTKVRSRAARAELSVLERSALIKKKNFIKYEKRGKRRQVKKIKIHGWVLNERHHYLAALQQLLIDVTPVRHEDLIRKFSRAGRVKLIIISGVFLKEWDSRIDLLVVGDRLKKHSVETAVHGIEAELGRELKYTFLDTEDFKYRISICDRLVRDVFDYPHEKVLDRVGFSYK